MPPAIWISVQALWLLAMLAGLGFCIRGLRGQRINANPYCLRCRFDLSGRTSPGTCPECGTDLHQIGAIGRGVRRVAARQLVAGLSILLGTGSVLGLHVWARVASFNWNGVKPAWLLAREARDANVDGAALAELTNRLKSGTLSPVSRDELLERQLALQLDAAKPWIVEAGDFIQEAKRQGLVSDKQWSAYLRTAIPIVMFLHYQSSSSSAYPSTPATESLYLRLTFGPARLGSAGGTLSFAGEHPGPNAPVAAPRIPRTMLSIQGGTMPSIILPYELTPRPEPRVSRERFRLRWTLTLSLPGETPEMWSTELESLLERRSGSSD